MKILTLAGPQEVTPAIYRAFLETLPVRRPRKILLINLPQVPANVFDPETAKMNGYHIYPPIGYLYLAAAAKLADPAVEFAILDLNYELLQRSHLGLLRDGGIHTFWQDLIREAIDVDGMHVGVGNMFDATTPMFMEILQFIRANFPEVTLVTGGVQTTLDYRELVDKGHCDLVFRREPEMAYRQFLESCRDPEAAVVPGGIAFKWRGEICTTPLSGRITEFLDIRPYYSLIDVGEYHKYGGVNPYSRYVGKEKAFSTVLSNRGCRASCTFCSVESFNGSGVRRRTARSVVDEIKYLVEHEGIRVIEWLDDDLLYGRQASLELFKTMAEELPPGTEWIANNGVIAGAVTEEIMYWMVQSGCKAFKVGVESGNEAMLRKIQKPGSKASLRKSGEIFNKYPDVFVSANFIVGFPEETFGDMMDSYDFANELSWDWANYYICQPLPGSEVFDAFQSLGDDRCGKDGVGVYNPGKSTPQKGNFGYDKGYHADNDAGRSIASGRGVFDLPRDLVPSHEQIKEIWFTFNLVTNFINNRNFRTGGNIDKIVRWFESIYASYPRDAAMCAMLAFGHRLLENHERARFYRERFHGLVDRYDYWKRRVEEFPELLDFADR